MTKYKIIINKEHSSFYKKYQFLIDYLSLDIHGKNKFIYLPETFLPTFILDYESKELVTELFTNYFNNEQIIFG